MSALDVTSYRTCRPTFTPDGAVLYVYDVRDTRAPSRIMCMKDREPFRAKATTPRIAVDLPTGIPTQSGKMTALSCFAYRHRPGVLWVDTRCGGCTRTRIRTLKQWQDLVRQHTQTCNPCHLKEQKLTGKRA